MIRARRGDGLDELWRADSVYCHPIIGDADLDRHSEIIAMVHSSQEMKKGEALCLAVFDRTETDEWMHFDSELGEYGYHDAAVG